MNWFSGKTYDAAAGRESRSAFIAQAAFWIAAVRFLTSGVTIKIGTWTLILTPIDPMLLGAFLAPCLALYWGRRNLPGPVENHHPTAASRVPGEAEG